MNRQEIFDKVATHLMTQRKSSMDVRGNCVYRAEGGLMCAIGALIPDKLYDLKMEGNDLNSLLAIFPHIQKALGVEKEDDAEFLQSLQYIHDDNALKDDSPAEIWLYDLENFARRHRLNDDVLDKWRTQ